jgi:hypothetical protein
MLEEVDSQIPLPTGGNNMLEESEQLPLLARGGGATRRGGCSSEFKSAFE